MWADGAQVPGFLAEWVATSRLHEAFFLSYGIGGCRRPSATRVFKLLELRPSAAEEFNLIFNRCTTFPHCSMEDKCSDSHVPMSHE
jgi:hypothetical protein